MKKHNWHKQIKGLLKSELAKRNISYKELALKLKAQGIQASHASINNKLSRGTFSAVFLLQCLRAIDCSEFKTE